MQPFGLLPTGGARPVRTGAGLIFLPEFLPELLPDTRLTPVRYSILRAQGLARRHQSVICIFRISGVCCGR
ncbi:Uncharacterised protein [Pannonibacter phragmitetus]|uniref:Uncharacterized protein n=1 Tax=Pannonibacter phragmitetus TaxID=121719 RepID=A0A378ZXJ4_9HYPH|nr:Uncharacterised protein [Pannonibacter phragmitetus]